MSTTKRKKVRIEEIQIYSECWRGLEPYFEARGIEEKIDALATKINEIISVLNSR